MPVNYQGFTEVVQSLMRRLLAGSSKIHRSSNNNPRILCYHDIAPESSNRWIVENSLFQAQMAYLHEHYNPVGIQEIVDWLVYGNPLPKRAVAVTFDDGYRNVYVNAFPIMEKYGIPGTAFVCPNLIACDETSDSRRYMNWEEVSFLRKNGWSVGSHTINHAFLAELALSDIRKEVVESKKLIEQELGFVCDLFCYPYGTPGAVSEEAVKIVKEAGYRAAFMATTGGIKRSDNVYKVNRSKVLARDEMEVFRAIIQGQLDLWSYIEKIH